MSRCLKGVVVCSAVLLLLAVLLLPTEIARGAWQRKKVSRAHRVDELYNKNCARCHGADGRGDTPSGKIFNAPDFTDAEWWQENSSLGTRRTLRSIVTRGKAGMPAFGKKLTKAEINLLVDRVRRFRKVERKS